MNISYTIWREFQILRVLTFVSQASLRDTALTSVWKHRYCHN